MKDKKPKKVEFSLETIQNNPVTRKQLEGFIEEVALSIGKVKTEQDSAGAAFTKTDESHTVSRS